MASVPHYQPRTGFYPVYQADQFLTSTNLNDTSDFLEKEIRATRSYLIGNGVAKGLDQLTTNYKNGIVDSIQVNAGYGLTPDGYLLETPGYYPTRINPGPVVFGYSAVVTVSLFINQNPNDPNDRHSVLIDNDEQLDEFINPATQAVWDPVYITKTSVECIELFTDLNDPNINLQTGINPTPIAGLLALNPQITLENSVLVFMADLVNTSNANCGVGSCDDQGVKRKIMGRFLLIPLAFLQGTANVVYNTLPYVQIAGIPKIAAVPTLSQHYANVQDMYVKSQAVISNSLNTIRNHYPKILPNADMNAAMVKFNSYNIKAYQPQSTVHYNHFVIDMHAALTEYTRQYNEVTYKFPDLNASRIDRIIILGHVLNTNAMDPFRYYFSPSINTCGGQCDILVLKKCYNRLIAMMNSFIYDPQVLVSHMAQAQQASNTTLKITQSREPFVNLGEKCIPYYYDMSVNYNPVNSVVAKGPNSMPYNQLTFQQYPARYAGNTGIAVATNLTKYNTPIPVNQASVDTNNINVNDVSLPTIACNGIPTQYTGGYNLLENWNATAVDFHIEQVNNYYIQPPHDPAIINTNINKAQYNFIKVEGHYGLPIVAAHADLIKQIGALDVPVTVVHATVADQFDKLYPLTTGSTPYPKLITSGGVSVSTYRLDTTAIPALVGCESKSGFPVGGTHILINDGDRIVHCACLNNPISLLTTPLTGPAPVNPNPAT